MCPPVSVSISLRYSITKFENFDSPVRFSFVIIMFTPKMISPDCPFKSNQKLWKILILALWCAVWLRGGMHTAELDSAVWCTLQRLTLRCASHHGVFFRNLSHLTLQCEAHHGVRLLRKCPFPCFWILKQFVTFRIIFIVISLGIIEK